MLNILDFLRNYWREIVYVICAIITIIFWIVKKKPVEVIDTIKENICRLLPYCIREAEKLSNASGQDKKKYALNLLWTILVKLVSVDADSLLANYSEFAAEQVEVILSTPQKKEAKK